MRSTLSAPIVLGLLGLVGCPSPVAGPTDGPGGDTDAPVVESPRSVRRTIRVRVDGEPVEGVVVVQGGVDVLHRTDAAGEARFDVDLSSDADHVVIASHPEARQAWEAVRAEGPEILEIDLERYDSTDNPGYFFQDPGTPQRRDTTGQCAHCHTTLNEDWYDSPHRTSASNAHVQDLYAGTVSSLASAADCEGAGGSWQMGLEPGTAGAVERCYLGTGVLPELDPSCAPSCEGRTEITGSCADCHAPGIDGASGGRHLWEATGIAYEAGVHCDVCHKVDVVSVEDPRPGVAGKLAIHRPSEADPQQIAGPFQAIQFGPHHDSPNPRMGSVQRDHYASGEICAGCHEHDQEVVLPGAVIDTARWPEGRFPVHSTWSEWRSGPFGGEVPCNACHMPPAPGELNGANLQDLLDTLKPGVTAGWVRPPGSVRHHSWLGPRAEASRMLELAAAVDVEVEREGEVLSVEVVVSNVGAGHRLPTGEPGRQVVLHVRARCGDQELQPVGGDAIPDWVGFEDSKVGGEDWMLWPSARIGDTLRLVRRAGYRSDPGFGPFADGTFSAEEAGNARWEVLGIRTITQVTEGRVGLDAPLPDVPSDAMVWLGPPLGPSSTDALPAAGAPGHAFARVLTDPAGRAGVPHHRAVDVRLDNRLGPHEKVRTEHRFAATCEAPEVRAVLTWRAHPAWLASEKRWSNPEKVMAEVGR